MSLQNRFKPCRTRSGAAPYPCPWHLISAHRGAVRSMGRHYRWVLCTLRALWHRFGVALVSSLLLTSCFTAQAEAPVSPELLSNPDNPRSQVFQKNAKTNRDRIAKQLGKDAPNIEYFIVPAMSEVMRNADVYPEDGQFRGTGRIFAAQGEYEPVSFQLFAFSDKKNITFKLSDLKSRDGGVLLAKNLDLKVVKIWYQNGNRWDSYFSDVGLRLVPELLLKDENMIRVNTDEVANYARLNKGGKETYHWISAPKGLDDGFDAMQPGFEDSKTLQPVTLTKDQFKQFFLTIHVPENQKAGVYNGSVTVVDNGKDSVKIPISVRVLPFQLPLPGTYQKIDMPVVCSVMGHFGLKQARSIYKDEKLAMAKYIEMIENVKAHGLFHPMIDETEENINLVKGMGFPMDVHFGDSKAPWYARNFGGRLTFDNLMAGKAAAKESSEFYKKVLGHNNILVSYGDEQGGAFVVAHRDFFKFYEQYGIRMGCAGHKGLFLKGAHVYGNMPIGSQPGEEAGLAKLWRAMDGDKGVYVGFYACQHTGAENPAFIRRQNGMQGYLNGMNMINNYEFATGPWNDLVLDVYKPMVVAYRNYGGIVDTLQWEGYREAVDDIRYATLLQQEIQRGLKSPDQEHRLCAKIALRFFAMLQPVNMDLDAVRGEMALHILKLKSFDK